MLLSWTGEGRSTPLRAVVVLAGTAATIPVGVLLALESRRRSLFAVAVAGFVLMSAVTVLTMLVLTATPSLIAIVYRPIGIVIGAALLMSLEGRDPVRWQNSLRRFVPLMIPLYLFAVAFVYDLLSPHWRSAPEAFAAFDIYGLLPFYHYYIVSKAQAAESLAAHVLTFAPIGVMVALRRGEGRAAVWTAGIWPAYCHARLRSAAGSSLASSPILAMSSSPRRPRGSPRSFHRPSGACSKAKLS